jgi:hypothetical protein
MFVNKRWWIFVPAYDDVNALSLNDRSIRVRSLITPDAITVLEDDWGEIP